MSTISRTQRLAFESILGIRNTLQMRVYKALLKTEREPCKDDRGLTSDELVVMFQIQAGIVTVQPRLTELHQKGLIYRTTRTRFSRSKREQSVWRIRKHVRPIEQYRCPKCKSKLSGKQARMAGLK